METVQQFTCTPALSRLEKLVEEMQHQTPMITSRIVEQLRGCLTNLPSKLSKEENLQAWKLSYSIWNSCVDFANNLQFGQELDKEHAMVRQIASDLLLYARDVDGVDSSLLKIATFLHRTGLIWHQLKTFELAAVCFEKATELISAYQNEQGRSCLPRNREDNEFIFDLYVARSNTAWELSHKEIASSFLGRARALLVALPQNCLPLAETYFDYGRALLKKEDTESQADSIKYLEQAYEISCAADDSESYEGIIGSLKVKILRYLAAGHLQRENYESVLKCLVALKSAPDHPSTSYLAVKSLAALDRYEEAEKELFVLIQQKDAHLEACMSAIEIVLKDPNHLDACKRAFLSLQSFYPSDKGLPVRILEHLLRRLPYLDVNNEKGIEVVLDIATNEDIVRTICLEHGAHNLDDAPSKEQECVYTLLWNSGSDHFHAKRLQTSIKLFEASMLYLSLDIDRNLLRAKSLRVLCLCRLLLQQFDRATEYVIEAEKVEPNTTCSFLKLKIYLHTSKEVEAIEQVEKMPNCRDFDPEYLTLASHEALACGSLKVAISAMVKYLSLPQAKRTNGTKEVIVLRNIVQMALKDPDHEVEAVKYLKDAQTRLQEVGSDVFFGSGRLGQQEANWFASTSWNQGLRVVRTREWQLAADLFSCASDFYSCLPEARENLLFLHNSLLLATSSLLESSSGDECIKLASRTLDKCRKVHKALAMSVDPTETSDDNSEIYLNLLAFDLQGRSNDHKAQLDILFHCSSLPGFTADKFLTLGSHASKTSGANSEVVNTAYRLALKFTLSSASPNYHEVAMIVRNLIRVADQLCKDGPDAFALYKQAKEIIASLSNGDYPSEELEWLVATSWNRAALHVKFLRFVEAERWMEMALDLANHVSSIESRIPSMVEGLDQVRKHKQSTLTITD